MRTSTIVLVAVVATLGVWCGYTVSGYRFSAYLYPAMAQSRAVNDASMSLRFVELIDRGDVPTLRRKLLVLAHSNLTIASPQMTIRDLLSWKAAANSVTGPLHEAEIIDELNANNTSQANNLRTRLHTLCEASVARRSG